MKKAWLYILTAMLILASLTAAGIIAKKICGRQYRRQCKAVTYSINPKDPGFKAYYPYREMLSLKESDLEKLTNEELFLAFVDYPAMLDLFTGEYQHQLAGDYSFEYAMQWCDALRTLKNRPDGFQTLADGMIRLIRKLKSDSKAYDRASSYSEIWAVRLLEMYFLTDEPFYALDESEREKLLEAVSRYYGGYTRIHPEYRPPV